MNYKLGAYGILRALSFYEKEDERIECLAAALEALVRKERELVADAEAALRSVLAADEKNTHPLERLKRARGAAGLALYKIETAEFWRAFRDQQQRDLIQGQRAFEGLWEALARRSAMSELAGTLDRIRLVAGVPWIDPTEETPR